MRVGESHAPATPSKPQADFYGCLPQFPISDEDEFRDEG